MSTFILQGCLAAAAGQGRRVLCGVPLVWAALAFVLPYTAESRDLVPDYGTGGYAAANLPKTSDTFDQTVDVLAGPGGTTIVAGTGSVGGDRRSFFAGRLTPAGDLDPSFGDRGVAEIPFGGKASLGAAAVQPDGKVLLAGQSVESSRPSIALTRLTANGSLDPSFGGAGTVTIRLGGVYSDRIEAMALGADGRIAVAGQFGDSGESEIFLGRFLSNGALDPSFGDGGLVRPGVEGIANDLELVGGKLAVAIAEKFRQGAAVMRVGATGKLDPGFGDGGISRLDFGDHDGAMSLAVDGADRLYLSSKLNNPFGTQRAYAARLLDDGSLDPAYADAGVAGFDRSSGSSDLPMEIEAFPDGRTRLYTSGYTAGQSREPFYLLGLAPDGSLDPEFGDGGRGPFGGLSGPISILDGGAMLLSSPVFNGDFTVTRLTPSGELDQGFGEEGTASFNGGRGSSIDGLDGVRGSAIDSEGRLVMLGTAKRPEPDGTGLALARFNPDGKIDLSFADSGFYRPEATGRQEPGAVAVQPDNRILATYIQYTAREGPPSTAMVLARYLPDGSPDPSFSGDGRLEVSPGGTMTSFSYIDVADDGKIYVARSGSQLLTRVNSDGTLDASFGSGGSVPSAGGARFDVPRVLALSGGRSLVVEGTGGQPGRLKVSRFNADGALDRSFGQDGVAETPLQDGQNVPALEAQSSGKPVISAIYYGSPKGPGSAGVEVARLNLDGSLDRRFGKGGVRRIDTHSGAGQAPLEVTASDGIFVASGDPDGHRMFALDRDGDIDRSFSFDGSAPITTPKSHKFQSINGIEQFDGDILVSGSMVYPISESGVKSGFPFSGVQAFGALLFKASAGPGNCEEAQTLKRNLKAKKQRKQRQLRRAKRRLERAEGSIGRLERKEDKLRKAKRRAVRKFRAAADEKRTLC